MQVRFRHHIRAGGVTRVAKAFIQRVISAIVNFSDHFVAFSVRRYDDSLEDRLTFRMLIELNGPSDDELATFRILDFGCRDGGMSQSRLDSAFLTPVGGSRPERIPLAFLLQEFIANASHNAKWFRW